MPLNFQPERTDPTSILGNQRSIARHLDDTHYVKRFSPGDFIIDAGPTAILINVGGNLRWPAIDMPDAAVSRANTSFDKPSEWRSGRCTIQFWYTIDVGSTANFVVGLRLDAVRTGEVLNGTNLLNINLTIPGPAAANTVARSSLTYTTTSFGADDELFALSVARIGTDAADLNVNHFRLLFVRLRHLPAQMEGQ